MDESPPAALPAWLERQYPFRRRLFRLPSGHCLHFVDEGSGPPVVLLHGNPTWSFLYRDLIRALAPTHRCLALDHLGMGLSDKPADGDYTLAGRIRDVQAWLEHLALPAYTLVMHDWGGAIGCGVATRQPEQVERLVVLNTAAFKGAEPLPRRIALARSRPLGPLLVRGCNGFVRGLMRQAVTRSLPAEVRRAYHYPYPDWASRVAIQAFVDDIPFTPGHPSAGTLQQIEQGLPALAGKPIQIIWGLRDWCFDRSFLAGWQQRFPHAQVQALEHAHHLVTEDAPRVVSSLTRRFLES